MDSRWRNGIYYLNDSNEKMINEPLVLSEKAGFKNLDLSTPVIINDFREIEFYNNSDLKNRGDFNLPKGTYFVVSGEFVDQGFLNYFPLNKLPFPERFKSNPFNFDIVFGNNPHKATINWHYGVILFDTQMKKRSLPELFFILLHEFAHSKFRSEEKADSLAENMLIRLGFNPSQIAKAPITSLSDRQGKRKNLVVQRLIDRKEHG